MTILYKIVRAEQWREAEACGIFYGSPTDLRDGFIHLSERDQVVETAARHFAGESDLLLVAVQSESVSSELSWEPARGGALFPHLHGPLRLSAVYFTALLPLGHDGRHVFPELRA